MIYPWLAPSNRGGTLAMAGAIFALGLAAGAAMRSAPALPGAAVADTALATVRDTAAAPEVSVPAPRLGYPAEIVRVIDGDTFEARVRVWPGVDINTKVRLRNVDAPELHARCADELTKAQAARAALQTMLGAGGVTISQVGIDKYGGRVDALVATRELADVSAALLNGGFARSYDGGKRASWC
jgi:endonuclease YncB( thermonuclease family)